MTVNLSAFAGAGAQFFDNNGVPLSGGLIYSYDAGTTTPRATYTDNGGGTANIWMWGRKNGTDIAQSASRMQIQGNNAEAIMTVNFFVEMSNGDYFELMYAVDDVSVIILAEAATAFAPAVPSVILTVNQVNL